MASVKRLQENLGYTFNDTALLELAVTHKSHSKDNNERLEYLGDAVLGYLIAQLLYDSDAHYREDVMSLMRAGLVRGTVLADVATDLGVADLLKLGSGERKSGGRARVSILADAMEGIIGAIHEDGGIEPCRQVVSRLFTERLTRLDPTDLKDAKTRLQEVLQGRQLALPQYTVAAVSGADHARRYTVVCRVTEYDLECEATETSRRDAEKSAAALMLAALDER